MTLKLRWYAIKKSRWDKNIKKYRAFDQNEKHMITIKIDDGYYTGCKGCWFVVNTSGLGTFRTPEAAMKVAEDFVITREMEKANEVQSTK